MMNHNTMQDYQSLKDFEEFLLVKWKIISEFQNWIKDVLLQELESVYKNWSDFARSWELMNVLSLWREMLKKW